VAKSQGVNNESNLDHVKGIDATLGGDAAFSRR
jgi:hypothetical protein